jgi:hypothetical protein
MPGIALANEEGFMIRSARLCLYNAILAARTLLCQGGELESGELRVETRANLPSR